MTVEQIIESFICGTIIKILVIGSIRGHAKNTVTVKGL